MFWTTLQRTIFWELIKAFGMSLLALTSILLIAGIVAEASQRGLSPAQIMLAIPFIIPSTLPYTIPSTTLFATCVVYGRLAHDNEIIAVKAAGINILKLVMPAVMLGLLTSTITFVLYLDLIPTTQYALRAKFLKDVEEFLYAMLKNERTINHPRLNYAIWVRQMQGRRLLDATFKRRDKDGRYDLVARAREAELLFDPHRQMILVHMRHGEFFSVTTDTRAFFEDRVWEVEMPESPFGLERKPKAREMNWPQLFGYRQEVLKEYHDRDQEIQRYHKLHQEMVAPPYARYKQANAKAITNEIGRLKFLQHYTDGALRSVDNEINMRPAISLGCLCFVLVGCPVGIWFSKRDFLSAFITCFLPIVLVYYPLLLFGLSLGRSGRIPAGPGAWVCDIVLALAALFLIRRLMKH